MSSQTVHRIRIRQYTICRVIEYTACCITQHKLDSSIAYCTSPDSIFHFLSYSKLYGVSNSILCIASYSIQYRE